VLSLHCGHRPRYRQPAIPVELRALAHAESRFSVFGSAEARHMPSIYDFSVKSLDGKSVSISDFRGKPLLIVNTASKCGFAPQFSGLEAMHRLYGKRGLAVLGFPSDQFNQEYASEAEIGAFCHSRYGVSFPMFQKVVLNGPNTHPLYEFLKASARGIFFTKAIKWNFTKFLVDREGRVRSRYAPSTGPEKLEKAVERLL
jgi:glutathione peroxidase